MEYLCQYNSGSLFEEIIEENSIDNQTDHKSILTARHFEV
jgi:hypothetical protein